MLYAPSHLIGSKIVAGEQLMRGTFRYFHLHLSTIMPNHISDVTREAWSSPRDNNNVGDEEWDEEFTQFVEEPWGDDDGVEVLQRLGPGSAIALGSTFFFKLPFKCRPPPPPRPTCTQITADYWFARRVA